MTLWRGVVTDNSLDALIILGSIPLEKIVCLGLRGRLRVRVVEKVLNAKENLLHRDRRLPGLLLVQDRQANGA